jgi:hypothetical protein
MENIMANDFLKSIFAGLLSATAAFTQTPMAIVRPQGHQMMMANGSAKATTDSSSSVATSTTGTTAKLLIFAEDGQTAPGHQITIMALGLANDAENLIASVTELFRGPDGTLVYSDSYSSGDGNAGYIPSLTNYGFTTLVSKKVPAGRVGLYQFIISVAKYPGGGAGVPYQTTTLSIPSLLDYDSALESLHIDALQQTRGSEPVALVTGHFPANVPLYYFIGTAPYSGGFSNQPSVSSSDGTHLLISGLTGSQTESRVILMLPDGSFSTTSAQAFTPSQ